MARISRKKGLRRVPANKKTYIIAIILVAVVIVLISIIPSKDKVILHGDEVLIGDIDFPDILDEHYIRFKIMNPTEEQQTCFLNMTLSNDLYKGKKKYSGYVNISPKSNNPHMIKVDMPDGTTEVRIEYTCA